MCKSKLSDNDAVLVFWAHCLMSFGSLLAFLEAMISWGEDRAPRQDWLSALVRSMREASYAKGSTRRAARAQGPVNLQ